MSWLKFLGLLCSYLPTKIGPTQKYLPFCWKFFFFFQNDDQTPVTDTTFSSSKGIISAARRNFVRTLSLCIAFCDPVYSSDVLKVSSDL